VSNGEVKQIDLSSQNVLAMRDAESALAAGATQVKVCPRGVITPSARDFLREHGIEVTTGSAPVAATSSASSASAPAAAPVAAATKRSPADPRLFSTPEAEAVKKEICAVGKKLWNRSYVDGNGGNISFRIGPNEVICTPTLMSKLDLTPEDLCLVDLDGVQVAGKRPRTSEIFLHLEIYKAVPEAKSAVPYRRTRPPAPQPLRRRLFPTFASTTPCCSPTTASSAGLTRSPMRSGTPRLWTPTAGR